MRFFILKRNILRNSENFLLFCLTYSMFLTKSPNKNKSVGLSCLYVFRAAIGVRRYFK